MLTYIHMYFDETLFTPEGVHKKGKIEKFLDIFKGL